MSVVDTVLEVDIERLNLVKREEVLMKLEE